MPCLVDISKLIDYSEQPGYPYSTFRKEKLEIISHFIVGKAEKTRRENCVHVCHDHQILNSLCYTVITSTSWATCGSVSIKLE